MPVGLPSEGSGAQPPRKRSQVTGNVGLYYACYRLSLLGWNVMPTARNARGIDIVAYGSNGARMLGMQVKSLSARSAVPVGTNLDSVIGDFWLVVTRVLTEPRTYVLLPSEVRELSHRSGKADRASYWIEPSCYESDTFCEAWHRIGRGDA